MLGGTIATGMLVKDAVELQTLFRDISFLVERVPGQLLSWEQVQEMVTRSAARTGQTTKDMALAFREVYSATGDLQYSVESLDMIGVAATASGKSTVELATIAHMLQRKWGATGETMNDYMARFIEKLDRGGLGLDQLSARFDIVAGEAEAAGMTGAKGISQLFGILEELDKRMGAGMAARGLKTLLMYLKNGTTQLERFEKAAGKKFKFGIDETPFEKIRKILADPKMREQSMKVFTEMAGTTFEEMAKPFTEAYQGALKEKKSEKQAIEEGLIAYDKMIEKIGASSYTFDKLQDSFQVRKAEDPGVKLRTALNKVRDAFSQPKMVEAIEELADKLPVLADKLAEFIAWVIDNPWKTGALAIGGRVGAPMMSGMMFGAGEKVIGEGGGGLAMAGLRKLGPYAGKAATALGSYSKKLTEWSTGPMAMHNNALKAAAGMGAAAAAGWALGTVIREQIIDPMLKEAERKRREAHKVSEEAAAGGKLTVEQRQAAIEEIRQKKRKLDAPLTLEDIGPTSFERGLAMIVGEEDPEETRRRQLDLLTAQEERHMTALEKALTAQEIASEGLKKFGEAAGKAAGDVGGGGPGPGSARGPKAAPASTPGAVPKPKE
jgi:alkylhydroperoxidase/carboxymuconolactone decarboxylase family protein YurZ